MPTCSFQTHPADGPDSRPRLRAVIWRLPVPGPGHRDLRIGLSTLGPTWALRARSLWLPSLGQRLPALKRTSMASRRPSPMKLKPTTTATMQNPAGQICHQYPANV